ncbi:hypothetical protein C1645_833258 [Glomus cerebriforme]|uniref:F-box domain-containing protein n=1 Tax=Glomus cerebriforme TaxID=658196 RepID=A0A397SFX2_9GLOM|nr:hypothetical protein C1645_833258 [Glomus cerebriforme]
MSCQLPADCLNEIFEYLDDRKTLYSCLLVNRFVCKISIRILWRNIWNIRYTVTNKHRLRVISTILSTLIACLPNESKELLFKNGIFISTPTSKPPLFNYPTFCKVLSIKELYLIINGALEKITYTKDKNYLVINEVIKMFITQIFSLKKLSFHDGIYQNKISFTYFSGAIDCLKDLSELHCCSSLPSEFFYQLSKICHNLHSLTIFMEYYNYFPNELKELISLQNNLKILKLSAIHGCDWTVIIPALSKNSNTLTKLHLYSAYNDTLPISFIALFSNLQEIKILSDSTTFGKIQFKDFEKLQHVTFPKLQYLNISHNCTKLEYIMKFLENNGKQLKKFYINGNDHVLNLSIVKFCPNLKNLSIVIKYDELDTLRTIFNSCQYLESIKIWCGERFLGEKEVLETITKYSPKNFGELKIYNRSDSELLPEDLESFFISWKNRPSFTLIINKKYNYISLEANKENMKIIKKYINLGIIKKFETKDYKNKFFKNI